MSVLKAKTNEDFVQEYLQSEEDTISVIYNLIAGFRALSNQHLEAIERALGCDGPILEWHQRSRAIGHNLEAMRELAESTFYLLPGLDVEDDEDE